ncbi:MAG: hypothetical protein GX491_19475 [Chloroflexi bacterium]|nr:hypothetical protein [Chloroflexota bacterium]
MKHDAQRALKSPGQSWFSSAFLLLLVGGAAGGVLSGVSPAMMIAGAALGLILWEASQQILNLRRGAGLPSLKERGWTHFKVLSISVGSGLLLAEVGLLVHFPLPFGIVILAVLLIQFSLYRFCRLVIN